MESDSRRQALVIGGLMMLFGVMLFAQTFFQVSTWIWVAALIAAGLGVLAVYTTARSETWMLIVSYVLFAIALLITLVTLDFLVDTYIAVYVLSVIAIPFVVGYFRLGQENWGLLIPAYVMFAVAGMLLLLESGIIEDETVATYVLLAVALPFLVVFVLNTKQWWALIVGGLLALIGIAILFATNLVEYILPVALILIGGSILVRQVMKGNDTEASDDPNSGMV